MSKIEFQRRLSIFIRNKNLHAAGILILFLIVFYRDVVFDGRTFLIEIAALGTMLNAELYHYKGTVPVTKPMTDFPQLEII